MTPLVAALIVLAASPQPCERALVRAESAAVVITSCSPGAVERFASTATEAERMRVARALAAELPRRSAAVPLLTTLLSRLDEADRARFATPATAALEAGLRSQTRAVPQLVQLVGAVGPAAHAALGPLDFVGATYSGAARGAAVTALSVVGKDDAAALAAAVRALDNATQRSTAVDALARLACTSERYAPEATLHLAPLLEGAGRFGNPRLDERTAGLAILTIASTDDCIAAPQLVGTFAHLADSTAPTDLRRKAILALASPSFVHLALPALPALVQTLREPPGSPLFAVAAHTAAHIADGAADLAERQAPQNLGATIGDLKQIGSILDAVVQRHEVPQALYDVDSVRNSLKLSVEHLQRIEQERRTSLLRSLAGLFQYAKVGNWAIATVGLLVVCLYAVSIAVVWSVVLAVAPAHLVGLAPPDSSESDRSITFFGLSLSPGRLLFVAPFATSTRALDAWIGDHKHRARERLAAPPGRPGDLSLKESESGVPAGIAQIVARLRGGRRSAVLILGPAGSGKTAVLNALAQAVLDAKPSMLPVRFDERLNAETAADVRRRAAAAVAMLTDTAPLPDATIDAMLRSKRIVLIFDDVSHVGEATRRVLEDETSVLDAGAVIFASRVPVTLLNRAIATYEPLFPSAPAPASDTIQESIARACRFEVTDPVALSGLMRDLTMLAVAGAERPGHEISFERATVLLGERAEVQLGILARAGLLEVVCFGTEIRFVREEIRSSLLALRSAVRLG